MHDRRRLLVLRAVRCLVTGATGLIGSAITRQLLASGIEVHALVRSQTAAKWATDVGASAFEGSLGDPNAIAEAAKGCEVIVHAAGTACVRASARALGWIHVAGTENALIAAAFVECRRFIHISCTDVTLINGPRAFWDEDVTPTQAPLGALAKSKLAAEEIVRVTRTTKLNTVVLRPALVWGAGDRTRLPHWCAWGLRGNLRLIGSGKHMMATTHAENVAHGVVCALERELPSGRVFHVLDAETPLARDFFSEISRAAGLPSPKPGRPRGVELSLARLRRLFGVDGMLPVEVMQWGTSTSFNGSRARVELGYEPQVDRSTGMQRLADWIREQGGAEAVVRQRRAPPTDHDIAEQVELADAVGTASP